MVKIIAKIYHSFILLIVGLGLIGINVSKLYCVQCEEFFLQVKVIPQANECPCEHGCNCCENQKQDTRSGNKEVENVFYKVTDFSQTEQSIVCAIVSSFIEEHLFPELSFKLSINYKFLPYQDEFPDDPLSPELLCIYRC